MEWRVVSGQGWRLVRREDAGRAVAPVLDEHQRAVVAHEGGPLLVLAGPGTGKTTTIVETVADRIESRGVDPGAGARPHLQPQGGRGTARTHHRPAAPHHPRAARADLPQLRLRAGSRRRVRAGRRGAAPAAVRPRAAAGGPPPAHGRGRGRRPRAGRTTPSPRSRTRGFADELRDFLLRAAERGLDGRGLAELGRAHGRDDWVAAGGSSTATRRASTSPRSRPRLRGARSASPRRRCSTTARCRRARAGRLRRGLRGRVPGHRPGTGAAAAALAGDGRS